MAKRKVREESESQEKPKVTRIRAFKWNQTLPEDGVGLLMLLIKPESNMTVSRTDHNVKDVTHWTIPIICGFKFSLEALSSKDNMENLARQKLQKTHLFQQDGVDDLASKITKNLFRNFCFSVETLSRPNAAKIVIVVDIEKSRAEVECDQVKGKRGKYREIIYGNDDIVFSLRWAYLKGPAFYDQPIASDEPLGLVEVAALNMFKPCDGGALEEDACAICLEALCKQKDKRKTSCSHVFHGGCLALWLWRKQSCPMCRSQLP